MCERNVRGWSRGLCADRGSDKLSSLDALEQRMPPKAVHTNFVEGKILYLPSMPVIESAFVVWGYTQGVQELLYGLSTYSSESAEWTGMLPLGRPADNYTISITGLPRSSKGKSAQGVALLVVSQSTLQTKQILPNRSIGGRSQNAYCCLSR